MNGASLLNKTSHSYTKSMTQTKKTASNDEKTTEEMSYFPSLLSIPQEMRSAIFSYIVNDFKDVGSLLSTSKQLNVELNNELPRILSETYFNDRDTFFKYLETNNNLVRKILLATVTNRKCDEENFRIIFFCALQKGFHDVIEEISKVEIAAIPNNKRLIEHYKSHKTIESFYFGLVADYYQDFYQANSEWDSI